MVIRLLLVAVVRLLLVVEIQLNLVTVYLLHMVFNEERQEQLLDIKKIL